MSIGGGGGGFLSAIGSVVGGLVGGPIGSMVGQALGGLLNQVFGQALSSSGLDQSTQEGLLSQYRDSFRETSGLEPAQTSGSPAQAVDDFADAAGATDAQRGDLQRQVADLQSMVNNLVAQANENDSSSAADSKPGKGDSWLVAIAKAMGATAGKIASDLVHLSTEIGNVKTGGDESQQQEAAKQMQELNAQFQAQSQMLNLVSNSISTGLKSIGDAMTTIARKQ
ncbi:MAG TPA: hypothetical protein VGC30_06320 [Dokdonella sp.]